MYLVYILIIALVYYIFTRTEQKVTIDKSLTSEKPEMIENPEMIEKPEMSGKQSNEREGFLFWRDPENPVHKNVVTVHV